MVRTLSKTFLGLLKFLVPTSPFRDLIEEAKYFRSRLQYIGMYNQRIAFLDFNSPKAIASLNSKSLKRREDGAEKFGRTLLTEDEVRKCLSSYGQTVFDIDGKNSSDYFLVIDEVGVHKVKF